MYLMRLSIVNQQILSRRTVNAPFAIQEEAYMQTPNTKIVCGNCFVIQPERHTSPRCHSCGRPLPKLEAKTPTAEDMSQYQQWLEKNPSASAKKGGDLISPQR